MTSLKEIKKLAQLHLKSKGFYGGAIDGIWGSMSNAAERAYSRKTSKASTLAKRLVALALKETGVRESPRNSNRGKRVGEYQAATWLEGTGWAWCAAYICWLCKQAGMPNSQRPQTAGAWDFENWARKKSNPAKLIKPASKEKIREGDILVLKISHICLATDDESDGLIRTNEGNTDASGSREGGGVYNRTRRKSEIRSIIRL